MAKFTVKIDNVLGGISPTQYYSASNQFESSIGIDPDMPADDSSVRISGLIRPTALAKFSSTGVTNPPLWFLTNPKDANIYAYMADGKVTSYTSSLSSETAVGTPTSGAGNGAEYYDNYLYFATPTDISAYGPLSSSPAIINTRWTSGSYTGTSGGFGRTALTNTTYPTINGVVMPNHPMFYHASRNRLYFGDVVSGQGALHYIATTKTTVEGDTNNGTTYNALNFNYGYYPTCISNFGTDLAVGLIQGTNTSVIQKNAVISFWDTTSTSPTKIIDRELPDPLITAMRNVNGNLFAWTGNAQGGCRLLKFLGGYSFQEVGYWEECYPPLAGAVDHFLNRIVFGGNTTYPEASACVYAVGSKSGLINATLPSLPIHNILKSTASTGGWVTALKYVLQADNKIRQPIVGWKDTTPAYGIDKISTTYGVNVWRSQMFRIGKPFQVNKVRIPLTLPIGANHTITGKIYVDELQSGINLPNTINNTNYANSQQNILQQIPNVKGLHNFLLELRWTGSAYIGVSLPVIIEGETLTDSGD